MKELNLGWGESVAVRQAFLETTSGAPVTFDWSALEGMGYPAHEGDSALVELTKRVIKRQTGNDYKHVLITNGATGGCVIAMRTYAQRGKFQCWVEDPPYFAFYPIMVRAAGLELCHLSGWNPAYDTYHPVILIHSPHNPLNIFSKRKKDLYNSPVIWDAVYHNNVYTPGKCAQPEHDVVTGSYSKLTGMNGIRSGWLATNDSVLYERMKTLVTAEYCGMSAASTKIILDTAGKFSDTHWELFERNARNRLDYNREQWSKVERYFGGKSVDCVGMFYYSLADNACQRLMSKSNIVWTKGSSLGTSDDYARINLGQDMKTVQKAVKNMLKNDKR